MEVDLAKIAIAKADGDHEKIHELGKKFFKQKLIQLQDEERQLSREIQDLPVTETNMVDIFVKPGKVIKIQKEIASIEKTLLVIHQVFWFWLHC